MIDADSKFFAILTDVGAAKLANANVLGVPWNITEMGLGDANNTDPQPSAKQTKLINEWRRRPLNQLIIDPVNAAVIIAEQVIPADEGGRWIREVGLYDSDGDLVAVANCAPSFKPILSQGSGRTQVVRMNLIVSSAANISLKIDPAVVLATRDYVDSRILEELSKLDIKQSVRAATTANINLVGLQTIDGVALVAGDRVLVKNQASAKDNGPYVAAVGAWTRTKDADSNAKVTPNLTVAVEAGATQADTIWQLVTDGPIVVGTTTLTFKDITDGFARLFSPSFSGNPTAPTPVLFDSSKSVVTTEFVRRRGVEFADYTNYSASSVLTTADIGKVAAFASPNGEPMTATLPVGALIPRGAVVEVMCGMGSVTVKAGGTDIIDAVNYVGNITLSLGDTALFIRIGSLWRLIGGSAALKYSGVMSGPNFQTQPQFDSSKSLATTEFVKRMGVEWANFNALSASTVLGAGSVGGIVSAASPTAISLTLPPAGLVAQGAMIMVMSAGSGAVTLQTSGSDLLTNASGMAVSVVLGQGDTALLTRVSNEWRLIGGTVALRHSTAFASSISGTGYAKRPDGLIEQWGQGTTDANGYVYVTFPIPFPNAPRNITLTHVGSQCLMHALMGAGLGSASCTIRVQNAANAAQAGWTVFWRALGN